MIDQKNQCSPADAARNASFPTNEPGQLNHAVDAMRALSDNELMQRVCAGETEALGILFERHQAALLRFLWRFTRNESTSEDLVQDVFVRILRYRHTFGAQSEFAAWMYGIARNLCFRQFRKREREVGLDEALLDGIAGDDPTPDEVLSRQQDLRLLARALAQLPAEKREILELSRIRKLKYRNIAERLGCEVGTVKVRVLRATREIENRFFELFGKEARQGRAARPLSARPSDPGQTHLSAWLLLARRADGS